MKEPLYLFLLTLNNAGSTAFIKFLNTSPNTSLLWHNGEGHSLPSVHQIMFTTERWEPTREMPWEFIKAKYLEKWNHSSKIILEKSPPNLIRAKSIQKVFPGCKFIVMNRNPYAQCSSKFSRNHNNLLKRYRWQLFRKNGAKKKIELLLKTTSRMYTRTFKKTRNKKFSELAHEWLFKSEYQQSNLETLSNVVQVSYEEFTEDPVAIKNKMLEFCPELESLDIPDKLEVKDRVSPIRDFNQEQIEVLKEEDIKAISDVLRSRIDLLDFFGYDLL